MSVSASGSRFHGEPPLYLTSPLLAQAGLPHLFSTRHLPGIRPWRDPAGPFEERALELLASRGLGEEAVAFLRQVHGARVLTARRAGLAGRGDILITDRAGLPLGIFTADCLPIVVYDQRNRRLAVAHAGWRGTVEAAARVAAEALIKAGGEPRALLAAIGPSIGPCCYEVDTPVVDRLEAAFPGAWRAWVTVAGPGNWMLDLWKANEDQLKQSGLGSAQIDNPRLCTACRTDLFFSFRRGRGQGRLVTVAAIGDGFAPAC